MKKCPWHHIGQYENECELGFDFNCCDCHVGDLVEEHIKMREALSFAREAARINIAMWAYKNEVVLLDVIKCADCLLDGDKSWS